MATALTDSQTLLAFKAGRSFRRANTNSVDAQQTKGALILSTGDEGLLRLLWKERPSGDIHEELMLFPGDASFEKVSQDRSGKTYVLKFESSDHKHFVRLPSVRPSAPVDNACMIFLVLDAGNAHPCQFYVHCIANMNLQDASSAQHDVLVASLNRLLADPTDVSALPTQAPASTPSTSQNTGGASSSTYVPLSSCPS